MAFWDAMKSFGATILGWIFAIPVILLILKQYVKSCFRMRWIPKFRPYPQVLLEETWEHRFEVVNGVRLHMLVAGSGPLMLCLHGFPEFCYSWRHYLRHYREHFTVVAVDMRGYGESSKPGASWFTSDQCNAGEVVEDVAQLIPRLGFERCAALVGHDWGGVIAYALAFRHPHLVQTLSVLNVPHPSLFEQNAGLDQLRRSWYMLFFRVPLLPEVLYTMGDAATIDAAFRGKQWGAVNKGAFTEEDIDAYKWAISQAGAATCAINYYRCLLNSSHEALGATKGTIDIPTLTIWGTKDPVLSPDQNAGIERHITNVSVKLVPNAGHWVQNDAPEAVLEAEDEFLRAQGLMSGDGGGGGGGGGSGRGESLRRRRRGSRG